MPEHSGLSHAVPRNGVQRKGRGSCQLSWMHPIKVYGVAARGTHVNFREVRAGT